MARRQRRRPACPLVSPVWLCLPQRRSVRTFAAAFKGMAVPLHVLALNAGSCLWPYKK